MKIVVCVRQSVSGEINPFDACAYEAALQVEGAEVILLSMGPGKSFEFLKSLDVIIDGPFILSQRDLSLRFRGSKNQRLVRLEVGTGKILSIE